MLIPSTAPPLRSESRQAPRRKSESAILWTGITRKGSDWGEPRGWFVSPICPQCSDLEKYVTQAAGRPFPPSFDDEFRIRFEELLVWRRDVRRFRNDPVPPHLEERLLDLVQLAPSVGNSQPWRFVRV